MSTIQHFGIGEEYDDSLTKFGQLMEKSAQWNFDHVRLGFPQNFSIPTIESRVAYLWNQYRKKSVLDLHNWAKDPDPYVKMYDYFGSDDWMNSMVGLAQHFAGDPRIFGIQTNEWFRSNWASNIQTGGDVWRINAEFLERIRAVGFTGYLILPDPYIWDGSAIIPTQYISDGMIMGAHLSYDKAHWPNPDSIVNYGIRKLDAFLENGIPVFMDELTIGVSNNTEQQMEFGVRIVNACLERGIGINFWKYSYPNPYEDVDRVLRESNYQGPPPPECYTNADCAEGEICVEGKCVAAPPECRADADCQPGYVCVAGKCVPGRRFDIKWIPPIIFLALKAFGR